MKKTIVLFFITVLSFSQKKNVSMETYFPQDSLKYNSENIFDYNYKSNLYGETTLIKTYKSKIGNFQFVLKKKIKKLQRLIEYKDYATLENFDLYSKKWEFTEDSNKKKNDSDLAIDTTYISEHNLYAMVYVEDHGKLLEKCKFQDFGNIVYWPEFDYSNCLISDENKDGYPEFYLSYMGESDGLDAKPYKQIVYSINQSNNKFIKSKAKAFYPAGNEEDIYHVQYDKNWKNLHIHIKAKSKLLIELHKNKYNN